MKYLFALQLLLLITLGASAQEIAQWEVYEEIRHNATYSGNPFDLIARVTFTHSASGETRSTEMYYDGDDTWTWRFNGSRQGTWTYVTSSTDPDLDGFTGTINVTPNPDPQARGFLTTKGNKYALMSGADATGRDGYIFTVYQDDREFINGVWGHGTDPKTLYDLGRSRVREARSNGTEVVYMTGLNSWFKLGAISYEDHNSTNPDIQTFEVIEHLLAGVRAEGGRIHFWAWGDEYRKTTPVGVGEGINGTEDRRVQRYIAARLGPLVGWSMGYGFDNVEWVTKAQAHAWISNLHERMGWPHVLSVRGWDLSGDGPIADAYGSIPIPDPERDNELETTNPGGPDSYAEILEDVQSSSEKPTFYAERHIYKRTAGGPGGTTIDFGMTMDATRRALWRSAMAGGAGFWIGYFGMGSRYGSDEDYPNPEQFRTHYTFWHANDRFDIDYGVDNSITNGVALRTPDNHKFVFYREDASSIGINLSKASGTVNAIAVRTDRAYSEHSIHLATTDQTWTAPATGDWAVYVTVEESPGQGTAPTLLNPMGMSTAETTADGSVATDVADGTLYWVVTRHPASPSKDQVKAAKNHTGIAAETYGSQAVSSSGKQNVSATELAPGTVYHFHFMHENASANQSPVATSTGFTTDGVPGLRDAILSDSPVFYFRFEETSGTAVSDETGNGWDSTPIGVNLSVSTGESGLGSALGLDGDGDRLVVDKDDKSVRLDGLTIEIWLNYDANQNSPYPRFISTSDGIHDLEVVDATRAMRLRHGASTAYDSPDNFIVPGELHHYVGVIDRSKGEARYYRDSILIGTVSANEKAGTITIERLFDRPTFDRSLKGIVDEVAFYNYALSESRIAAHANDRSVGGSTVSQSIALQAGWNLIGAAVQLNSVRLEQVFSEVQNEISIVKDEQGRIYSPNLGINTIGTWDPREAYMVHAYEDAQMHLSGLPVVSNSLSISLKQGWNLLPYVKDHHMAVGEALAPIRSQLVMIEDLSGNLYHPDEGVTQLEELEPGQGYKIYMKEDATFIYP